MSPPNREVLVSVIVACRNAGETLRGCLQSVLGQTHPLLEVLVVDDGSTDNTVKVVQSFSDPRLRLRMRPWLGAQSARNFGISNTRGELVQFVDGDDQLAAGKIAAQVARYLAEGADFVYLGPYTRFYQRPNERAPEPTTIWRDHDPVGWLADSWDGQGMMPPHAWLVPRPLLKISGGWDERLQQNQDGEFFCRVILASQGVRFCPDALSYYRVGRPGSVSTLSTREARESLLLSAKLSTRHLLARENSARCQRACSTLLMDVATRVAADYPDLAHRAHSKAQGLYSPLRTNERARIWHWLAAVFGWRFVLSVQPLVRNLRSLQTRSAHQPSLGSFQPEESDR